MRIDIGKLLNASGNSLEINLDIAPDLCANMFKEVQRFDKLTLTGTLENLSGVLSFKGDLGFSYVTECGRCLEEVSQHMVVHIEDNFYNDTVPQEDNEKEYFYSGKELDLSKFILDNIALNIPFRHLCSENCKGFCDQCGKNQNHEECTCKDEYIDPRLSKLKDLLK